MLYPILNVNIYIDKHVNTKKTSNLNGISLRNTKNNITQVSIINNPTILKFKFKYLHFKI